jgi:hypothetical protein
VLQRPSPKQSPTSVTVFPSQIVSGGVAIKSLVETVPAQWQGSLKTHSLLLIAPDGLLMQTCET